jgi:hypothetical protein
MPGDGIPLGDVLADSGYARRDADAWALPLRAAGAQLVQDLHPHDRGPKGTYQAPSSATGTCTARPRPARCWSPGRSPGTPCPNKPPHTTPGQLNWPGTSSAASPLTTPTATTASSAPRPWAKSAAAEQLFAARGHVMPSRESLPARPATAAQQARLDAPALRLLPRRSSPPGTVQQSRPAARSPRKTRGPTHYHPARGGADRRGRATGCPPTR